MTSDRQLQTVRRFLVLVSAFGVITTLRAEEPKPPAISQQQVIPILLRHCTVCHGARRQEAGLDLRTRAAMLRGGKSGPAFVVGRPDHSRLIQKIRAGAMPPPQRLVEVSVKPVDVDELDVLIRWIAAGAPEVEVKPDIATTQPDPLVTDVDRTFWSFQPPRNVNVPRVRDKSGVRNAIDAFILQRLEANGLTLSPEADRPTLLRRLSFDLTGLPPTPVEIGKFLNDSRPDAYERLVDRLLSSPHYGERWGRHWLDLAGYADSEGKREQDLPRPHAWRYRDYVIRAFNADKPYDRFLTEQIAGDELADVEKAREITQELADNLIATGFLRMVPDATWANITGYAPDRIEVVADEIEVLGSAVLGLSMKCARCHNHKFDPIPQRDYYRLIDIFKGAYDEYDWLKPDIRPGIGPVSQDFVGGRMLPHVTTAERRNWEANETRIREQTSVVRSKLDREADALMKKLPSFIRPDRAALKSISPKFRKLSDESDRAIRSIEMQRTPEPMIQALWDRGQPSPTYIYRRGDANNVGQLVGPGVPSVLTDGRTPFVVSPPWPNAKKTGRRLAFARWLTRADHPLTARVMVNRMWKMHFGAGLVTTLADFGKTGAKPTHPELLDWLAREFVRSGWSMKSMHRLMVTSAAYRQQSKITTMHEARDPDNELYSRMPMVRLDAEALYDSLLRVSDRLDSKMGGRADPVNANPNGLVVATGSNGGWRRLVYVQQLRKKLATHLETFDFPAMNPNCVERRDSTVAPQALHLMNNGMIHELAESFARRVKSEAGESSSSQVDRAFLIAIGRLPDDDERRLGVLTLQRFAKAWTGAKDSSFRSLTAYCHALMNSAAFLYVD